MRSARCKRLHHCSQVDHFRAGDSMSWRIPRCSLDFKTDFGCIGHGPRISLRRIQSHRAKYAQRNFWLVPFVIQDREIHQAGGSRKRGMSWNSQQIFSRSLFWPPFPSRSGSPARVSLMDPQDLNLAEAGTWRAPSPASWGWIKSKLVTTCRGTAARYATDRRYCVRSRSRASVTDAPNWPTSW